MIACTGGGEPMSIAYKKDEIVSASRVVRSFGKVLADLKERRKRRVAIAKNNELEAVILPIGEYETMAEALAVMEHIEIYRLIQERKRKRPGKRVSLDALLKEAGLAV
jgi:PHD/YefM family antitoxin component YafN of YafNO toxin-antitoxin module